MQLTNGIILLMFLFAILLFFWSTYKAMKTQEKIYLVGMIPLGILIVGMFLL